MPNKGAGDVGGAKPVVRAGRTRNYRPTGATVKSRFIWATNGPIIGQHEKHDVGFAAPGGPRFARPPRRYVVRAGDPALRPPPTVFATTPTLSSPATRFDAPTKAPHG